MLHHLTAPRLTVIGEDATVKSAALALSRPGIGLVVVCGRGGEIAGVISKSDLIRHLQNGGTAEAAAATQMSASIVSCRPEDDLYGTWQLMAARQLQHLPVLSDRAPVGVLDLADALRTLLRHEQYQECLLLNYIAGHGYQ
jgi:CBS domain-containing protein